MTHRDWVKRKIIDDGRETVVVNIERVKCQSCGKVKRLLPNCVVRNLHYSKNIVLSFLTNDSLRMEIYFEDYPCESTVYRWRSKYLSRDGDIAERRQSGETTR